MDLLIAIKEYYRFLVDRKVTDNIPNLKEIEDIAEQVYSGDTTILEQIGHPLHDDLEIKNQLNKIKEIVKHDKNNTTIF